MTTTAAIRYALEHLTDLPAPVHAWRVTEGLDSTDDPAVWILAIIDAEDFSPQTFHQIKILARAAVRGVTSDLWPYVTVRTIDEDKAAK